jgi:polyisoprenoid-binding protein YceI
MKHVIAALAFTALATPVLAQMPAQTPFADMPAGIYVQDDAHTSLTWKVNHLGLSNYTARFTKVKATLDYDPKNPEKSTVTAVIDPLSVRTDFPKPEEKDFDLKLATDKAWFNAGEFPKIEFKSTRIERTGETTGKIHGDLTMLGITKPVVLDATFNGAYAKMPFSNLPALGFSATTSLQRSHWGFDTYVPTIGDKVDVMIEMEFHKQDTASKE